MRLPATTAQLVGIVVIDTFLGVAIGQPTSSTGGAVHSATVTLIGGAADLRRTGQEPSAGWPRLA